MLFRSDSSTFPLIRLSVLADNLNETEFPLTKTSLLTGWSNLEQYFISIVWHLPSIHIQEWFFLGARRSARLPVVMKRFQKKTKNEINSNARQVQSIIEDYSILKGINNSSV